MSLAFINKNRNLNLGVEKHSRYSGADAYDFYLNCSAESVSIDNVFGINMLTGENVNGHLALEKYGVAVIYSSSSTSSTKSSTL